MTRLAARHRTDLSDLARAVLARPKAQLIIDAKVGGADKLRATADRYDRVIAELEGFDDGEGGGHIEIVAILRMYAHVARREALQIDRQQRTPRRPHFITLAASR